MAARVAQLSLFAVAIFIGTLLVGQLRSQSRPIELSSLSAQELSTLVQTLSARNGTLRDGLADVRERIREYERAEIDGQSGLTTSRQELQRIRAFGGLEAVEGQGIVLEIEGSFDPKAVNDLVHELRNAGAEAIAVDGVRVTGRSVAVLGTSAIEIDGVEIGSAFEISAIGYPQGLTAAMERPGGILVLLQQSIGARWGTIEQRTHLVVPATERDLAPTAARAVE